VVCRRRGEKPLVPRDGCSRVVVARLALWESISFTSCYGAGGAFSGPFRKTERRDPVIREHLGGTQKDWSMRGCTLSCGFRTFERRLPLCHVSA
jgi:hypothetical protein